MFHSNCHEDLLAECHQIIDEIAVLRDESKEVTCRDFLISATLRRMNLYGRVPSRAAQRELRSCVEILKRQRAHAAEGKEVQRSFTRSSLELAGASG